MPLASYRRVHPDAVVTQDQLFTLEQYLLPPAQALPSESVVQTADREYRTWIAEGDQSVRVQDSLNGIKFIPGYKQWKMIDSTSRFDADTLRIILGNDVAVKAIAEKRTNPWPDGTKFAKVGWHQQKDAHGAVHAGAFLKVGFMIKDKIKYASTAGWGWAEWEGTRLQPYGDNPGFSEGMSYLPCSVAEERLCFHDANTICRKHPMTRFHFSIATLSLVLAGCANRGSKEEAASNQRAALKGELENEPSSVGRDHVRGGPKRIHHVNGVRK